MYISPNLKSKAAVKRALAEGVNISIYQPGPFGGNEPDNAVGLAVEGPHFPEPHKWYGQVTVVDGAVVSIK